jgi:hypothetical protein
MARGAWTGKNNFSRIRRLYSGGFVPFGNGSRARYSPFIFLRRFPVKVCLFNFSVIHVNLNGYVFPSHSEPV